MDPTLSADVMRAHPALLRYRKAYKHAVPRKLAFLVEMAKVDLGSTRRFRCMKQITSPSVWLMHRQLSCPSLGFQGVGEEAYTARRRFAILSESNTEPQFSQCFPKTPRNRRHAFRLRGRNCSTPKPSSNEHL